MRKILAPLLLLSASALLTGCYTTTNQVSYTPGCSYSTTVRCNNHCKPTTCNTCATYNRCAYGACDSSSCGYGCGYGCGYSYSVFDNGWY